ncbi:MAG TPA: histidine phosphatase family protein [Mycobacteriales bacterium]|nr:histidine phosphatase family protein [Mycobacteriales bacterium]
MSSPPSRTTVHLLRHGEVANPDGVLYGRLPGFRLSAGGVAMAKLAAAALRDLDVAVVVASPMERARETAEPVAEQFGLEIVVDDRLIESWNRFEGLRFGVGDGALRQPSTWWSLRDPFTPSWGEPYRQVAARVLASCDDARRAASGRHAVLVSHQLPIWVARRSVERRRLWHRPDRRQCGLASITALHYDGDRIAAVSYTEPAGSAAGSAWMPGA